MSGATSTSGPRPNPLRVAIWTGASLLLLLPAVAMRFTDGVDWSALDFIVFGTMLALACGAYELGARASGDTMYRAAVGVAVAAAFLLVWVTLAVGIIDSERNPANQMYAGVLATVVLGAVFASAKPRRMAWVMLAAASAQAVVATIALASGPVDAPKLVGVTGFFVALWLASAWLFRRAAR